MNIHRQPPTKLTHAWVPARRPRPPRLLLGVLSVALVALPAVVAPPSLAGFAVATSFGVETNPYSVAAADLNGDGRPDLAVANFNSGSVSVLLNSTAPGGATAGFAAATSFVVGTNPLSVAAADLNGDGRPDLAVANFNAFTISVLLNTTAPGSATATFAAATTFGAGTNPASMATADLNGDGRPDLAVANNGSSNVSVLLNTTAPGAATAGFAAATNFGVLSAPLSVTAADLNGDGRPDLAVANESSHHVSVLLNTSVPGAATAGFAAATNVASGASPRSVAAADLNADGRPDLAVANHNTNDVSVLLNTTASGAATASLAAATSFAAGTNPTSVAAADLNGDGRPDLAMSVTSGISVLLNTTTPGAAAADFASGTSLGAGTDPRSVTAADLNGDGRPDLAVANSTSNDVSVLLNTTAPGLAAAGFAAATSFGVGTNPTSVTAADLNGDGRLDLATVNQGSLTVSVLLNTTAPGAPTASFAASSSFGAGAGRSVTAADLNGDGRPDLATANLGTNDVSVLLNTTAPGAATASFAAATNLGAGTSPQSVTAADLNGDGRRDLAVANFGTNNVSVRLNTTAPGADTASFAATTNFGVATSPRSVAAADLNGDGRPDLATANNGSANVSVLLNTTTPGATSPTFATRTNFGASSNPGSVAAADLNGDGRPDLAVTNASAMSVSVLLNTTATGADTASFAATTNFGVASSPGSVAAADLNGDGRPDLAVANAGSMSVSVRLNTTAPGAATASFGAATSLGVATGPGSVAAADLNGDGRPDLAAANNISHTVSVLLDNRAPVVSAPGITFAAQVVGATALAQSNTLTNSGNLPLVVSRVTVAGPNAGDFAVESNSCTGESIGSGLSCSVGVTFTPGGPGARSAFLVVTDTAFASSPRSIHLSGTGVGPLALSAGDVSVTEGNAGASNAGFVVSLSTVPAAEVKVSYATMPAMGSATAGTDYTYTENTLTFAAGTTTLAQTVNVPVVGDTIAESDEDIFVQLYDPTGGASLFDRWARGVIVNDDAAPPVLTVADAAAVPEGDTAGDDRNVSFAVTLSATPAAAVVVRYATQYGTATAGGDYTYQESTLTFAAGTTTLSQTVVVPVIEDTDPEADESLFVQLYDASGATIGDAYGQGAILNDDVAPPALSIADASVAEGDTAGQNIVVNLPVTLSATPTTDVVVHFATMGAYYDSTATSGADYVAAEGTVTFAAGTTTLTQQVTVAVVEETVIEPSEWFYVQIYDPTGATLNPTARYGKATITNDD